MGGALDGLKNNKNQKRKPKSIVGVKKGGEGTVCSSREAGTSKALERPDRGEGGRGAPLS